MITEADSIQMMFPTEPDWEQVSDPVLVELGEKYAYDQSCATAAIGLLSLRQHPRAAELAAWLLTEQHADKWLKARATDLLADG